MMIAYYIHFAIRKNTYFSKKRKVRGRLKEGISTGLPLIKIKIFKHEG